MKKIAVFSDIHGNYQALKSILDDIHKENFDEIICLGDLIAIGPSSEMCLDMIMNSNVKMVLGDCEFWQINNHDVDFLSQEIKYAKFLKESLPDKYKEYLKTLPFSYEVLVDGHLFTFSHFILDEYTNSSYPFFPDTIVSDQSIYDHLLNSSFEYFFFGHEHENFEVHMDNRFFSCIGSSGCVRGNVSFYTSIEIDKDMIYIKRNFVLYDRNAFENQLKQKSSSSNEDLKKIFFEKE